MNADLVECRKGLRARIADDPFIDATNKGRVGGTSKANAKPSQRGPRRATRRRVEGTSGDESDRENMPAGRIH